MRRRIRWRKVCKWAGTGVGAALVALFVASGWWDARIKYEAGADCYLLVVCRGRMGFAEVRPHVRRAMGSGLFFAYPLQIDVPDFGFDDALVIESDFTRYGAIIVPLQLILLAVLVPTALLWWLDRRKYPPGHCRKCGYDLTGNTSGICPECGVPTPGRNESAVCERL